MGQGKKMADQAPLNGRAFPWHEVITPDPEKAKAFYTNVLGWGSEAMDMGGSDYHMFTREGEPFCGITSTEMHQGTPPHWSTYISVEDVDATVEKAKAAGGTVVAPPMDVPTVGRMALLQDDQGAHFWVFKSTNP